MNYFAVFNGENKTLMTGFPIIPFPSSNDLNKWLVKNHATSKGIWLRLFKKDSGVTSITYEEAIIEAF